MPESKPLPDAFPEWAINPNLDTLSKALSTSSDMTALFKLANDDEFKAAVARLNPNDVKALRAVYNESRTRLDGKVRLDTFDGQVVNIVGVEWWHSDAYDNDGVTLHIRIEAKPDQKYKALTSSAPIVTFANRLRDLPSETKPLRVIIAKTPVRDPERAAKGHTMWSVKQMPPARGHDADDSVPF